MSNIIIIDTKGKKVLGFTANPRLNAIKLVRKKKKNFDDSARFIELTESQYTKVHQGFRVDISDSKIKLVFQDKSHEMDQQESNLLEIRVVIGRLIEQRTAKQFVDDDIDDVNLRLKELKIQYIKLKKNKPVYTDPNLSENDIIFSESEVILPNNKLINKKRF